MALLRIGSTGDDVKKLQTALGITADSIFGPQTEAAVKAYQQKNGLTVDGIAGSQTLGSIYKPVQTTTPAPVQTPTADNKINSLTSQFGPLSPGYAEAIKGGTESQYLQGVQNTVNGMDLSGLGNMNFSAPATPAAYVDPFADKINSLLDKYLAAPAFTYDPTKDIGLQAAQEDAMAAVDRNAARRGMLYSDSNKSQLGKSAMSLIPQFRQAAQSEYQTGMGNILNQLRELQGISTTNYNRNRDIVEDSRVAQDRVKNDYLATIGQFSENYQAEYNRVRDDGDPSNDWQLPIIQSARQEKIAGMNTAKTKAEQEAYERGIEERKLKTDERYTEAQITNMQADNARAWATVNEANGTKAEQKARDAQYQTEFSNMMSSSDPAAYLNSVRSRLHPDVYAELSKFIANPDGGPTLGVKDYLSIGKGMRDDFIEMPDPNNKYAKIKKPKYTDGAMLDWINGLSISGPEKDELANALGLPQ